MEKIGIIRCQKNEEKCPLTSCFRCLMETKEGFGMYEEAMPAGVFTCKCPGDIAVQQAKILKAKGADAVHFCTCAFAKKGDGGWSMEQGGFCEQIDDIIERVHREADIPCVKGTAHLPAGYDPKKWP